MPGWRLYCPRCGWEAPEEEYYPRCPKCGGPLELRGEPRLRLPLMGEGGTPLVRGRHAFYKLEYLNPTGSFKDRGAAASLQVARDLDYKCAVEDTSGNTGLAVAAYAAWLGLRARIHAPRTIMPGKARLIRAMGAELVIHPTRRDAAEAAARDSERCFHVAHTTSPIFLLGTRNVGRELAPTARGKTILVPASSGTLLIGLARGLLEAGVRARIIAVQASEAASLRGLVPLLAVTGGSTSKLADALVLRDPPRLEEMARHSDGLVIVGDEAIRRAHRALLSRGLIVEPSSSVVEAARQALQPPPDDTILILTGSGLKETHKNPLHPREEPGEPR